MNLILERSAQVPYFTNMRLVFDALGLSEAEYDWYLSDIETNSYGEDFTSEDRWISGSELREFLLNHSVQFIWGVFSTVPKGYRAQVPMPPYVDGNPRYWQGKELAPQLQGAVFEIACWDSSATILVGLPSHAQASFRAVFPDEESLANAALRRAG